MKFEITEENWEKFKVWAEGQRKKGRTLDASGFRYQFCFMPCGFGTTIKAVDLVLNEEIDLTDHLTDEEIDNL